MKKNKGLILIVEDEVAICAYMEELFSSDGFAVVSAANGKVALELLHGCESLPSVIFLDLMMPVMDGQRFINEMQNNPAHSRFKEIPVVVVTAAQSDVKGQVVEVLRKPADLDYLSRLAEKFAALEVLSADT